MGRKAKRKGAVIACTMGSLMLLSGCVRIEAQNILGGPFTPQKSPPEVSSSVPDLKEYCYMGHLGVIGSKKYALKKAAKLGARIVIIEHEQYYRHTMGGFALFSFGGRISLIKGKDVYSDGYSMFLYRER